MRTHIRCYGKVVLLGFIALFSICFVLPSNNHLSADEIADTENTIANSSQQTNLQIIEEILDEKVADFTNNGYFSQLYTPSLQGTYYGLYILDILDRLDLINQTEITNYIMAQFNDDYNIFMDDYSFRYLDTDFDLKYYPLTSILQTNCYVILSLQLLNRLNLIDTQYIIQFIWSCFDSEQGGFIGQPYDNNLEEEFKIATLDNTFFAVITLDLLMNDWMQYTTERDLIINYVNGLQSNIPSDLLFGGFLNDNNIEFESLDSFDLNILSCYYAIKTLEIFKMVDTIRIDDFNQYLSNLYDDDLNYFQYSRVMPYNNYSNIVATSIGLDLSLKTECPAINHSELLDFIINNRNEYDIWDASTSHNIYELIDTFRILKSLEESGNLAILTQTDKENIVNALNLFKSYCSFSLIPKEYTSQELMYSIIQSFSLYNRISDLELHELYKQIEKTYFDSSQIQSRGFYSYMNVDGLYSILRTLPIEYYNVGNHYYTEEIDYAYSHKNTYMALKSLESLFKLDDFEFIHDLEEILNSIINSQFLDESSNKFGAFLPYENFSVILKEYQEKFIFFHYSYYAIKCMDFITHYLDLGIVSELNFDKSALISYLEKNIVETPTTLYYNSNNTNNIEAILQDTYFLVDLLMILDEYLLDTEKIKNYILENIDYTNIKNIYYCYKLDEILDLGIEFDIELTHLLIKNIYDNTLKEFYTSTEHKEIDGEILYWICYMSRNDDLRVSVQYQDPVMLLGENNINVSICNIILEDFGPYAVVKYESPKIGTVVLIRQEQNLYNGTIPIPLESDCYPIIYGNISLYEGLTKIAGKSLNFSTTYDLTYFYDIIEYEDSIYFEINSSLITAQGMKAFESMEAYVNIYQDENLIDQITFQMTDYISYNHFNLTYNYLSFENYTFDLFLNDGIRLEPYQVTTFERVSNFDVEINYSPVVQLNSVNIITINLGNCSDDVIVRFESLQLKTVIFEKNEYNNYQGDVLIPLHPDNYPNVNGNISVYYQAEKVFSRAITFGTTYDIDYTYDVIRNGNTMDFKVNSSLITGYGRESYSEEQVFMKVYKDGNLITNNQAFTMSLGDTWNLFSSSYEMLYADNYTFELYLNDGISSESIKILTYEGIYNNAPPNEPVNFMAPLGIFMIGMPGSVIMYTSYRKNKKITK